MIAHLGIKGTVLMSFVSRDPNSPHLHLPWFNVRDGIAYASDRRTLVRVCNLLVAPCEVADWSNAPKYMDRFFEGVELLEDVSYRDLVRAAETARVLASCEYGADDLPEEFESFEDLAVVRVHGRFFRASYVARLCMATEMLYDGVNEPLVYMGGSTLVVAQGSVQAVAMNLYFGEDGEPSDFFVVADAGMQREGAR